MIITDNGLKKLEDTDVANKTFWNDNVDVLNEKLTLAKGDTGDTGPAGADGTNGTNGIDGTDGQNGADGLTPEITVTDISGGHTVTITTGTDVQTFDVLNGIDGTGSGDMSKSVYDTDNNGIVDNAEKVNNHTVKSDVPENAVFTDTTYTSLPANGGNADTVNNHTVESDVPANLMLTADCTLYVSTTGSDTAGDGSETSPYATINYAVSTIPKNLNGYGVTINLSAGTYDESVNISGFYGGKAYKGFNLIGGTNLTDCDSYIVKSITASNINGVFINGIKLNNTATSISIQSCLNCMINYCKIDGGTYGIFVIGGSTASLVNISINNTTVIAINACQVSQVAAINISGTGNAVGLGAGNNSNGTPGIIFKYGITMTATTAEQKVRGGQIFS